MLFEFKSHDLFVIVFFYIVLGFSAWLVQYLVYLKGLPIWTINLIVSTLTATMTEVVSNTATANILLPILKEMSLTLCYNPVYMGELILGGTLLLLYRMPLQFAGFCTPKFSIFGFKAIIRGFLNIWLKHRKTRK